MTAYHQDLAAGRWFTLSLMEQLGNIADGRWQNRLKEIVRAREVTCDFLVGNNEYQSTGESLEKYFMTFALAARNQHLT